MLKTTATTLTAHSISIPSPIQTRILSPITSEPCVQLRDGTYDIQSIGAFSYMGGPNTSIRHVQSIGRFCCIASNITAGQPEHPQSTLSPHPLFSSPDHWNAIWNNNPDVTSYISQNKDKLHAFKQTERAELLHTYKRTTIGHEVWIGQGVFIRRGLSIGNGAILAAHAVITKDVPPFAIVGGVPARIIGWRHTPQIQNELLELNWWAYGLPALHNVDIASPHLSIPQIRHNISSLSPWNPTTTIIPPDHPPTTPTKKT